MKAWQGSYGVSLHDGNRQPRVLRLRPERTSTASSSTQRSDRSDTSASSLKRPIGVADSAVGPCRGTDEGDPSSSCHPSPNKLRSSASSTTPIGASAATSRAKRKLIALLSEQKQAIIHRAVTRGLDPNVRYKPSGVEWLGDVPAHWEVEPLRRRWTDHRLQAPDRSIRGATAFPWRASDRSSAFDLDLPDQRDHARVVRGAGLGR